MKALGLEISKLKRSRLWLTLLLATGLELVWATALTVISLAKAPSGVAATTGYAIGSATDVHNLVAPIISAVVASRLAATEHDSTMLSQLLADGQSRTSLFLAKLTTALAICSVPVITLVATTTLVATANGVPTDLGMTATWLGGLLVANIAMTAIHLVLALLVHRQALTLSVGALGGQFSSRRSALAVPCASLSCAFGVRQGHHHRRSPSGPPGCLHRHRHRHWPSRHRPGPGRL